jgi:DNA-binding NarL/FixJ family response regulator
MKRTTILLAEDHAIVREGLRFLLESSRDFEIVAEAKTGREAVDLARKLRPEVVVMDIAMPILNGFEATRQILRDTPATKVLVLSAHSDDEYVAKMEAVGAFGYLEKQNSGEVLVKAIKEIAKGNPYFDNPGSRRLHSRAQKARETGGRGGPANSELTSRERRKSCSWWPKVRPTSK